MTTIPTIKQLNDTMVSNFEAEFDLTLNPLGKAFLLALAGVLSAMLYTCYISLAFVQKNVWIDTADSVSIGGTLERIASNILQRYPLGATPQESTATVTGSIGAVIPGNQVFKADDNSENPGALYQISGGPYTFTGTTGTISIVALNGGTAYGLQVGDTLTATSPIVNVNSSIAIASIVTDPIDAETTEQYRAKAIEKVQLNPGSWSAVDYRLVGLGVAGIGQSYPYANSGVTAGVIIYLQGTTPVASPGPSVPGSVITAYEAALDAVLPLSVWDRQVVSSPINNIDITIAMGTFPALSTADKAAVLAALTEFVNGVHPFIADADVVADTNDTIATFNLITTVSNAIPGKGFSGITFKVAGVTQTSWKADNGQIPYLNSITYA